MLLKRYQDVLVEAGCDEAGRGCLAGPVFAAAVVLPLDFEHEMLNDSKQITEKNRFYLREIIEKEALSYAVGVCSPREIDEINILNASFLAMHKAIDQLTLMPELLLIDGNRFKKYAHLQHHCIVKGDAKFMSIAAASILAKTYRDEYMEKMDKEFPMYRWSKNKGYPTKEHRDAIAKHGPCSEHRMSFTLLPSQLSLGL